MRKLVANRATIRRIARKSKLYDIRQNELEKGETRTSRRLAEFCSVTATTDYSDPCDPYEFPPSSSRARSLLLAISGSFTLSLGISLDSLSLCPSPCRVESVSVVTARSSPNKYCPFAMRFAVCRVSRRSSSVSRQSNVQMKSTIIKIVSPNLLFDTKNRSTR